jgi:hypothetical protein
MPEVLISPMRMDDVCGEIGTLSLYYCSSNLVEPRQPQMYSLGDPISFSLLVTSKLFDTKVLLHFHSAQSSGRLLLSKAHAII